MIPWLSHTSDRHQRVKTTLLVLCIISFWIVPVFAAGSTEPTALQSLQTWLHKLLSLLSRGWIVLAVLAGKLMTNEWVYGSFMHLDIYLWKIRNIIKNFANFTLMGLLLWEIINGLMGKGKLDAKKVVIKTLIAGILIQASRFLMGVILDISTIAMTAVSSFPNNFFANNSQLTQQVANNVRSSMHNKTYAIKLGDTQDIQNVITQIPSDQVTTTLSDDEALTTILPTSSSVSGPLIFLGMSVFRFQEYMNNGSNASPEALTIGFLLKAIIIIMYTVGLALLFVFNLIRIVFLWIIIILSPLLILVNVFKDSLKLGKKFDDFGLSSILWLVFRPVLFVLSLSFALIVIVSFQGIMTDIQGKSLNGVQMTQTATSSAIQVQGLSSLEISNDTLFQKAGAGVQNTFADILIFLLSVFLVWYLIKWSLTTGAGPGQKLMQNMTSFLQDTTKSLPIFGGFSANQISTFREESKKKTLQGFGMDKDGSFGAASRKFDKQINKLLKLYDGWNTDDIKYLKKVVRDGGDFFAESKTIGAERQQGLSLSTGWKSALEERLQKPENRNSNGFKGSYTDFESFFKGDSPDQTYNRWKLHTLMGGNDNEANKTYYSEQSPPTYDTLINNTYFKPVKQRTN